jgi:hypothetical protein
MVLLLLGAEESEPVFCGTGGGLGNLSSRQVPSISEPVPALAALHTLKSRSTYQ